jgi:hypothetical protein
MRHGGPVSSEACRFGSIVRPPHVGPRRRGGGRSHSGVHFTVMVIFLDTTGGLNG